MKKIFNLSLKQTWLLISLFSLSLPIFMPSSADPKHFYENVVGSVTVTMFILSFPSGLFGLPFLLFATLLLEIKPNSIEGLYLNLFLLFALGFVQWFWVVPRLLKNESGFQVLNLIAASSEVQISEASAQTINQFKDFQELTPLERVLKGKDLE
jgi:hypothetical protein